VDELFRETTIPYAEIIKVLKEHNWNGYMLSEWEDPNYFNEGLLTPGFVPEQLRRQHIMMKRLLGY
jgi:sugar phosphate isomerase/epimerase